MLSLAVCVPLTVLEVRRGALLGEGRGGRTLGWFLLPIIFLPGAYAFYGTLAPGPGSVVSGLVSGSDSQLFTQGFSANPLLWIAWIPVLVYSGLARDPARSKAGWVIRRLVGALLLFIILFALSAATWYALGKPGTGGSSPEWVSVTSNALFLIGLSSLVGLVSLFIGLFSNPVVSLPVVVASFAFPALAGRSFVRGRAIAQAAPPRLASDHARLAVTVRLHGSRGHKDVEMIVDTGATNTKITPSVARDLGISGSLLRSSTARVADGRVVRVGMASAIVEYGPWKARVPVQIMQGGELLLGITTLNALGLKVDPVAKTLEPSHGPRTG